MGLSLSETERRVELIESQFALLTDHPQIHVEWRRLIVDYSVSGVSVYDARLVAAMQVYGITHLLTRNKKDFSRYAGIITIVGVEDIL